MPSIGECVYHKLQYIHRLPGRHSGKEPTCQCRRCKRCGFDPWVWKIFWSRNWQPTPVFLPGKFHGQRSLVGCRPWGCKESDTTEQLNTHVQPIPSKSPAISSNKRLTQSVKQRCRMIPWKSRPACEWGALPHCWCDCNTDKVTSCYPAYLATHSYSPGTMCEGADSDLYHWNHRDFTISKVAICISYMLIFTSVI